MNNTLRIPTDAEVEAMQKYKLAATMDDKQLIINDLIDKWNLWQMAKGKSGWWFYEYNQWHDINQECLRLKCSILQDGRMWKDFVEAMERNKRHILDVTKSWKKTEGVSDGILNLLQKNFIMPNATEGNYNPIIDTMLMSVGGGLEGKEHIEQVIWSKYLHPENFMLPSLCLNDKGDTGKSLMVGKFLTPMFGNNVASANINHVLGNFNIVAGGAAILFINETVRDTVNVDKLKALLHSEQIMVEPKYVNPYMVDNTALVIMSTNSDSGAITLEDSRSDRRYSIISSKTNINAQMRLDNPTMFGQMDDASCTAWMREVGQHIISDPVEISKWLFAMCQKYGDLKNVEPLHGEDYKTMLERQSRGWKDTVIKIFEDPDFKGIRLGLLKDLIHHYNRHEKLPGVIKMNLEIQALIEKKGYSIQKKYVKWRVPALNSGVGSAKVTSSDVWVPWNSPAMMDSTDNHYGRYNNNDHWIWTWIE